jgi:predicted dehydrogenase
LEYFSHDDEGRLRGWRSIHVTDHGGDQPYMDKWWVPGCTIGYEHTFINALADFLAGLETGTPVQPDIKSGLRTQIVCDAVLKSAADGKWVDIA